MFRSTRIAALKVSQSAKSMAAATGSSEAASNSNTYSCDLDALLDGNNESDHDVSTEDEDRKLRKQIKAQRVKLRARAKAKAIMRASQPQPDTSSLETGWETQLTSVGATNEPGARKPLALSNGTPQPPHLLPQLAAKQQSRAAALDAAGERSADVQPASASVLKKWSVGPCGLTSQQLLGAKIKAKISFASSPTLFYLQPTALVHTLTRIQERMAVICPKLTDVHVVTQNGHYAYLREPSRCWVRCYVREVVNARGQSTITCMDFDTGEHFEVVGAHGFKPLTEELVYHGRCVVFCCLEKFHIKKPPTEEQTMKFKELVSLNDGMVFARFYKALSTNQGSPYIVRLESADDRKQNYADQIISKSAVFVENYFEQDDCVSSDGSDLTFPDDTSEDDINEQESDAGDAAAHVSRASRRAAALIERHIGDHGAFSASMQRSNQPVGGSDESSPTATLAPSSATLRVSGSASLQLPARAHIISSDSAMGAGADASQVSEPSSLGVSSVIVDAAVLPTNASSDFHSKIPRPSIPCLGIISAVSSPEAVFIQQTHKMPQLLELNTGLVESLRIQVCVGVDWVPKPGSLAAFVSHPGEARRCLVLSPPEVREFSAPPGTPKCSILLIDYGLELLACKDQLRPLPAKFCIEPAFAFRCVAFDFLGNTPWNTSMLHRKAFRALVEELYVNPRQIVVCSFSHAAPEAAPPQSPAAIPVQITDPERNDRLMVDVLNEQMAGDVAV